jgi:hypothetical protein
MISDVARPFAFVLIILAITSAFAGNAGAAINPVCYIGKKKRNIFIFILYFRLVT